MRLGLVEWLERQVEIEQLVGEVMALVGPDQSALDAALDEAERRGARFRGTDGTVAGLQSVRRDLMEGLRIGVVA